MIPRIQTSWSGSESQRLPQGVCTSNDYHPAPSAAFFIPAGTHCEIARIADSTQRWHHHKTRRDLSFDRPEGNTRDTTLTFREQGYWLRLPRRAVLRSVITPQPTGQGADCAGGNRSRVIDPRNPHGRCGLTRPAEPNHPGVKVVGRNAP